VVAKRGQDVSCLHQLSAVTGETTWERGTEVPLPVYERGCRITASIRTLLLGGGALFKADWELLSAVLQPNQCCCYRSLLPSLSHFCPCFVGPHGAQSHHPAEVCPWLAGPHSVPPGQGCHHHPAVLLPTYESQAGAEGAED